MAEVDKGKISGDVELLDSFGRRSGFTSTDTWRVFRIMGEFVEGFESLSTTGPAIAVFGGARIKPDDPIYKSGRELGRRLAEEGLSVITGGGPGLMEAVNRGCRERNGFSIGCNIELPHEQAPNQYLDLCLSFHYFFVRKMMFLKYSLGFVVFPGASARWTRRSRP